MILGLPHYSGFVYYCQGKLKNGVGLGMRILFHVPPLYDYPSAPNRGITLWVQQFWAMFLKRFYNSVRFFGALFSQFLLPMLFVLFALVLAVTIPGPNQDDPRRALLLENSALSDNITVFYVEFGNEVNSPLNFSVSQICNPMCMCMQG